MLSLLACRWRSEYITPAPGLLGYCNADEPTIFDLVGLNESPATTQCSFWLELDSPAKLHPLNLHNQPANGQSFYLEVQAVTVQQLRLALWVKYLTDTKPSHQLTYTLARDEAQGLGIS